MHHRPKPVAPPGAPATQRPTVQPNSPASALFGGWGPRLRT
jgi:hypothetical protein